MSGGVDSSVTAMLLKRQGYEVVGVFMQNWDDSKDPNCMADTDRNDARAVCDCLEIPLYNINFIQTYWDRVFQYFLDEYAAGRTPNPDVLCNKEIKFRAFLDHALNMGADYIATGHYAQNKYQNHTYYLYKGNDPSKEQSYFLYMLNQQQLRHAMFPLGDYYKSQVRQLAKEAGLPNASKKDSTGLCFIGERQFKPFLKEFLLTKHGPMYSVEGEYLGDHDGLMFYTIGQRRGLNIGGHSHHANEPWYVVDKDTHNNHLYVAQGSHHPALYHHWLTCESIHWITNSLPNKPFYCYAKIRYRHQESECYVMPQQKHWLVYFTEAQRAITPGQSVVFYNDHQCLGGGTIIDRR